MLFIFSFNGNLSAQIYIKCATNLYGGEAGSPYDGEAKVQNDITYMVWDMREATNNLLGAGAQPHSGAGQSDIYIAVVDENCVQTVGTYSGGSGEETAEALIINDDGTFFITGTTASPDFPTTDGTSSSFPLAPFVQKYAADGSLIYSTILNVEITSFDESEIISDGSNAYLVFEARTNAATIANFTTDGTDGGGGGLDNVVVVKLDATGNIVYASSVGGSGDEEMSGVLPNDFAGSDGLIVELNGCLYLQASSESTDFPTTDGSTNTGHASYLLKYDAAGNLAFSTIIYTQAVATSTGLGAIHTVTDGTCVYTLTYVDLPGFSSQSTNQAAVSKFDAGGNLIYQQIIPDFDAPSLMIYQDGALYIGGDTYNIPEFPATIGDPVNGSMGVVKLDAATGSIIYASSLPSSYSFNTNIAVGTNGEVYVHSPDAYDAVTTNGTNGDSWYFAKLDVNGNLSTATVFNLFPGWSYPLTRCMEAEGNILTVVGSPFGNIPVIDNTPSDAGNVNYWLTRLDFCPEPPTITGGDVLIPATQMACANGVLEQILGEEHFYDGSQYPDVNINGIPTTQADTELSYQWQFSFTNSDPWTDIAGAAGQQRSYTPPPSTQDVYYRRMTIEVPCCGDGTPLSVSTSVFIDIDDTVFAPEPDAGGQFYACPNSAINIGNPPNSATGGQAPYTYLWSNGETIAAPSVSSMESAIYTLTVTDANGCMQVDQANVTIYTADAGADKAICDGVTATLGGSPLPGVNVVPFGSPVANEYGIAYTWTPSAGLSDANIPNPTASTAGTYTLTVTIYQPSGSSCQTTDVVEVAAFTAPTIADFAGPDRVLCIGETTTLGTPAEDLAIIDISSSTVTQSSTDAASNATATAANLTDNDFTTGGHTDDDGNILIDLGSSQIISKIEIAALDGFTNDDDVEIELSTDGINFIRVADPSFSLSETELTSYEFPAQQAQYIRFVTDFSSRDVSLSEVRASFSFRYIWTPGDFISATNQAEPTFDSGNIDLPDPDPYTYTVTANIGDCNYYDQVSVYVIEARAGDDGCGPRTIGEGDRTPNINETYAWRIIPELTDGDNSNFTGPTDQAATTVSGNTTGETHYELTTTFVLDGQTYTCLDTVIVPPCGCGVDIVAEDGGCADFDSNPFATLVASVDFTGGNFVSTSDVVYTWTPMEGLDTYTGQRVVMQDNVERTYTVTVTSLSDPNFICTEDIPVNLPIFATPNFTAADDFAACPGDMVEIGDPANNPGLSYNWNPVEGLDDATISNPTLTVSGEETYTIVVRDIVTGCLTRDTVEVSLDGQQAAAGPDLYICDNATVTIGTNTTLPGYTYSWTPAVADWRNDTNMPDPSQVNEAMPNVFVSTVGGVASSQTFTLTITSPSGCITTDEVTVFVNPLPPTLTLTDVSFCPSIDPVILGFTNSDGTGTNQIPGPITPVDITGSTVTQSSSSGGTATAANLTDGDFSTGGHTNDDGSMLIDLGSLQTINVIGIAALSSRTSDDLNYIEISADGTNFTTVADATTSLSAASITSFQFTTTDVRYIRFIAGSSNSDVSISEVNASYGYAYEWAPADLLENSRTQNPTLSTPLPSTLITFELKLLGGGGCNSIATQTITPSITQPSVAASSISTCLNEGVMIGSDDNIAGTYLWVADGGNPSGGSLDDDTAGNPTFTGTEAGSYTYTVTKTEAGCEATAEVTLVVQELIAPVVAPVTLCQGETGVAIGPNSEGGLAYSWVPTTGLSDPNIAQPFFTGTASQNYTLTIFNSIGCSAETPVSVTISTEPVPVVNLPDITECNALASTVILNPTVTPSGTYSYQWTPSIYLSSANVEDPTFFIPGTGTYEYVVEVTDQTTGCSTSASTNIDVNTSPPIISNSNATNPTTCEGSDGSITLTFANIPDGTYTINYENGSANPQTFTNVMVTSGVANLSGLSAGSYNNLSISVDDCTSTEDIDMVLSDPDLPVLATNTSDETCALNNGSIQLTITAGTSPYDINWSGGGTNTGSMMDETSPYTISNLVAGTYSITVTDDNGCSSTTNETVTAPTGCCPSVTNPTTSQAICDGETVASLSVNTDGTSDLEFVYFTTQQTGTGMYDNSGTSLGIVTPSGGMASISNISFPFSGTFYIYAILTPTPVDGSCRPSQEIQVTVNPLPDATLMLSDSTVCLETDAVPILSNSEIGISYQLRNDADNSLVGSPIAGTGNNISFTISNLTPVGTYTYNILATNTSTGCKAEITDQAVITVEPCDFQDYIPTCENPPCHLIDEDLYIGSGVSAEASTQGSVNADTDDDDGILIPNNIRPGITINFPTTIYNNTGQTAYLTGWIDWNGDQDFDDPGEQIVDASYDATIFNGSFQVPITIQVPVDAVQSQNIAVRYRLSTDAADIISPCGVSACAADGEIEDYLIRVECPPQICLPVQITIDRNQ